MSNCTKPLKNRTKHIKNCTKTPKFVQNHHKVALNPMEIAQNKKIYKSISIYLNKIHTKQENVRDKWTEFQKCPRAVPDTNKVHRKIHIPLL